MSESDLKVPGSNLTLNLDFFRTKRLGKILRISNCPLVTVTMRHLINMLDASIINNTLWKMGVVRSEAGTETRQQS